MNFMFQFKSKIGSTEFRRLIQIIQSDEEIRIRIIQLLKLDSYQRRNVLNRWLEQLRRDNASEKLTEALSFLFDNDIAKKVSTIINRHHVKD